MTEPTIQTADGVTVQVGATVYNYYDMTECQIAEAPDSVGWFHVTQKGGPTLLNGERICSLAHAKRMGWLR